MAGETVREPERFVLESEGLLLAGFLWLRAQAVQLEAVVSVGYGTRSTREVTGAVIASSNRPAARL